MALFQRIRRGTIKSKVKIANIYVVTSTIISSHNDGSGCGPMCVTMYFLAKCKGDAEYYEFFSGRKLENEKQFDIPYVEIAEPLSNYFKNPNKTTIDIQSLFDFITNMNVLESLGTFSDELSEE